MKYTYKSLCYFFFLSTIYEWIFYKTISFCKRYQYGLNEVARIACFWEN